MKEKATKSSEINVDDVPKEKSSKSSSPLFKCSLDEDEIEPMKQLRKLVDSSTKLKGYNLPDKMLIKFLRARGHNVEVAGSLIKSYIGHVQSKPDLFRWSDEIKDAIRQLLYYPYQHRGPNGEVIVGLEIGKWDCSKLKFDHLIQASICIQEYFLDLDDRVQKNGFVFLIDMRNLGWKHMYNMGITGSMVLATLTDSCMPIKVINVHICYENVLTSKAYQMFRPFLSEELKRRLAFHGDDQTNLFKALPPQYLPPAWNGTGGPPDLELIIEKICAAAPQIIKTWESFTQYKDQ